MSAALPQAGLPMEHSGRREDIDDDDYPSSESDAEIDVHGPPAESQRLLAADEDANATQDRAGTSIPAQTARAHGRKRQTPLKWTEIIWVSCTLSLIAILGYSSQLCIMLPYYNKTPSFSAQALAAVLVPFNLARMVGARARLLPASPSRPARRRWRDGAVTRAEAGDLSAAVLQDMLRLQASAFAPLQDVRALRAAYGPPLSLACQLCGPPQLRALPPVPLLRGCDVCVSSVHGVGARAGSLQRLHVLARAEHARTHLARGQLCAVSARAVARGRL
ncbi:hypothetical protein L1887_61082 [Cichorium endivia]|nr:hypothetical protein L1887_61082 [Cichorium endivia]